MGLAVEVREPVFADLDLVAVAEVRRVDPLPVDVGAVEAALVVEPPPVAVTREHGVLARDGDVVEEDPALGRASDHRRALAERKRLAGAPSAGADDEDGALQPEIVESVEGVARVAERERLGLLALLGHHEGSPAPRAKARELRVVVPALGAVDVRHRYVRGVALPARISVSALTSTVSRTLRPSVFCRRATSSARRMSIFPCSSRRRYDTACS